MIPLVSEEIIDSIREQQSRVSFDFYKHNVEDTYLIQKIREIQEENPHLMRTIIDTVHNLQDKFDLNSSAFLNVVNIGVSVYESIKQQMICNDLHEKHL